MTFQTSDVYFSDTNLPHALLQDMRETTFADSDRRYASLRIYISHPFEPVSHGTSLLSRLLSEPHCRLKGRHICILSGQDEILSLYLGEYKRQVQGEKDKVELTT